MLLDAAVCRRLVAASCPYQGVTPSTALQVVQANASHLGDVVVIDVGYNDSWTRYRSDIDAVMAAVNAAGVPNVVWVNLRQAGANAGGYANINAAIQSAAAAYPKIRVADWNSYSAGQPWFGSDGLHLTSTGAQALATFVKAQLDAVPPNRCSPSTAIGTPAPPLGSLPASPPATGAAHHAGEARAPGGHPGRRRARRQPGADGARRRQGRRPGRRHGRDRQRHRRHRLRARLPHRLPGRSRRGAHRLELELPRRRKWWPGWRW